MSDARHTVALVVDRTFGERVVTLSERMHVWLIESHVNRVIAEPIWVRSKHDAPEISLAHEVTLFESPLHLSPEENVADILETIAEHHSDMKEIQIYGVRYPDLLKDALAKIGFVVSRKEQDHVVCKEHKSAPSMIA